MKMHNTYDWHNEKYFFNLLQENVGNKWVISKSNSFRIRISFYMDS